MKINRFHYYISTFRECTTNIINNTIYIPPNELVLHKNIHPVLGLDAIGQELFGYGLIELKTQNHNYLLSKHGFEFLLFEYEVDYDYFIGIVSSIKANELRKFSRFIFKKEDKAKMLSTSSDVERLISIYNKLETAN